MFFSADFLMNKKIANNDGKKKDPKGKDSICNGNVYLCFD